jgi:plastocyanin
MVIAVSPTGAIGTVASTSRERWAEIVKPRRRYVPLALLLGVLAAGLPAVASSETSPTVEAVNEPGSGGYGESHHWSPTQTSVAAGGVVTFSNPTAVNHGVEWVGGPAKPTCDSGVPVGTTAAAAGTKWSGTCTFAQAGTYTFYCTVHGPEMTGTITVSPDGTTTTTMTTTGAPPTTGTTPTPTPITEAHSGSPLVGGPSLGANQHGTSVHGSLDVSQSGAGDRLEVDLLASGATLAKAKHATRVTVGRFVRGSVPAGRQSFSVKLDAKAKRALSRRHRLALTVKIVLTSSSGVATTITRSVVEHG